MGEQSRLEKTGFERRSKINNGYDKNDFYQSHYEDILKDSELKKKGTDEIEKSHPVDEYMKYPENPFLNTGYMESKVDDVLKNSELYKTGIERRQKNEPGYNLDLEENKESDKWYGISDVKKGSPNDGGHIHSIPSDMYSPTRIIPQLNTFEGGSEKDVEMRERLTRISKYSRTNAYGPASIDTTENLNDGQYFMP